MFRLALALLYVRATHEIRERANVTDTGDDQSQPVYIIIGLLLANCEPIRKEEKLYYTLLKGGLIYPTTSTGKHAANII